MCRLGKYSFTNDPYVSITPRLWGFVISIAVWDAIAGGAAALHGLDAEGILLSAGTASLFRGIGRIGFFNR